MNKTALVILDNVSNLTHLQTFLASGNFVAETHATGRSALAAFKAACYRCVIVSMDIEPENPLEIISPLRLSETELGLPSTLLLVAGQRRQPSADELKKYNICGVIRSHRM